MRSFQKVLICLVAGLVTISYSCKKDDDPKTCNYVVELQAESNNLSAAATAYGMNPTTANCLAFVAAYEVYLSEAAKLEACATAAGQGAEFQQAILDAQANLDLIQC
jgi:hypothetical protein